MLSITSINAWNVPVTVVMRSDAAVPAVAASGATPAVATQESSAGGLDASQQAQLERLVSTDRHVRAHEAAHRHVGGDLVRGGSFSFTVGPDGRQYAVAGEVNIDASKVADDPHATVRKMDHVQRTALAPSDPSPQDRAVAAAAGQTAQEALAELQVLSDAQAAGESSARALAEYASVSRGGSELDAYA